MEKKIKRLVLSDAYIYERKAVFRYGLETFGRYTAEDFFNRLKKIVYELEYQYEIHPECRFLPTKNNIYRNIIFGKYLIIYRITATQVQVLSMLHSSRSTANKMKSLRLIKP